MTTRKLSLCKRILINLSAGYSLRRLACLRTFPLRLLRTGRFNEARIKFCWFTHFPLRWWFVSIKDIFCPHSRDDFPLLWLTLLRIKLRHQLFHILERLRISINYNSAKEIGSNWNLMRRWLIILKRIFSTSSFRQRNSRGLQFIRRERLMIEALGFSGMKTFSPMARDDTKKEIVDLLRRGASSLTAETDTFGCLGYHKKPRRQKGSQLLNLFWDSLVAGSIPSHPNPAAKPFADLLMLRLPSLFRPWDIRWR